MHLRIGYFTNSAEEEAKSTNVLNVFQKGSITRNIEKRCYVEEVKLSEEIISGNLTNVQIFCFQSFGVIIRKSSNKS